MMLSNSSGPRFCVFLPDCSQNHHYAADLIRTLSVRLFRGCGVIMVYIIMIMLRHGSYPWCAIWGLCWCNFFSGGGSPIGGLDWWLGVAFCPLSCFWNEGWRYSAACFQLFACGSLRRLLAVAPKPLRLPAALEFNGFATYPTERGEPPRDLKLDFPDMIPWLKCSTPVFWRHLHPPFGFVHEGGPAG